jgi:hypothetical protein
MRGETQLPRILHALDRAEGEPRSWVGDYRCEAIDTDLHLASPQDYTQTPLCFLLAPKWRSKQLGIHLEHVENKAGN